jgi:folate-dependent phosphoribosylglycinamide formyltransferase PurN
MTFPVENTPTKDIVVFTNGNLFSRIILEDFLLKYKARVSVVVIVSGDYYGNKGFKALYKFSKVTSIFYVLYKIWTILLIKILKIINKACITSVDQLCNELSIPTYSVSDINEQKLFEQINKLAPLYLVSVSCPQLIRKKWLDLVNGRGLNIHSSLLPKYGGLAPYFWVLANNQKETGITVHYLIKGFDKGNILSQQKLQIQRGSSAFSLFLNLCIIGKRTLNEAFEKMEKGNMGTRQDISLFTYFSHPTTSAYFRLKKADYSLFKLKDFNEITSYLKTQSLKIDH